MRKVMLGLITLISVIDSSCKKETTATDAGATPASNPIEQSVTPQAKPLEEIRARFPFPLPPGSPIKPFTPIGPIRTYTPPPTPHCIRSYQDLIEVLGTNRVVVSSVLLSNGTRITPLAADLGNMIYTARDNKISSSLFNSKLEVKWRDDAASAWTGFSADLWSAGCVYNQSTDIPFTNLIKGSEELLINTCMFWSIGVNAGQPIKDLVLQ